MKWFHEQKEQQDEQNNNNIADGQTSSPLEVSNNAGVENSMLLEDAPLQSIPLTILYGYGLLGVLFVIFLFSSGGEDYIRRELRVAWNKVENTTGKPSKATKYWSLVIHALPKKGIWYPLLIVFAYFFVSLCTKVSLIIAGSVGAVFAVVVVLCAIFVEDYDPEKDY